MIGRVVGSAAASGGVWGALATTGWVGSATVLGGLLVLVITLVWVLSNNDRVSRLTRLIKAIRQHRATPRHAVPPPAGSAKST